MKTRDSQSSDVIIIGGGVYVSSTNLFVFDHIGIYDPENSGDRGAYQYPLTKSFNFGINVSF